MSTISLHTSGPEVKRAKDDVSALAVVGYTDEIVVLKRMPKDPANLEGAWRTIEELHLSEKQTHDLVAMLQAIILSRAST